MDDYIAFAFVNHEHNVFRRDCFYYSDSCFKVADLIIITEDEIQEMLANDSIGGE